mgnify:CR=1 FL=1
MTGPHYQEDAPTATNHAADPTANGQSVATSAVWRMPRPCSKVDGPGAAEPAAAMIADRHNSGDISFRGEGDEMMGDYAESNGATMTRTLVAFDPEAMQG